jgi:N-acetylneuraminic acid mutarotase
MKKYLMAMVGCMLWLSICNRLSAHFLWLVPLDESGSRVTLYFSEGPEPDDPALLKRVANLTTTPFKSKKPDSPVAFSWNDDQSRLIAHKKGASAWTLTHTFGTHGRDEKNLIIYRAMSVACRRPGMFDKDIVILPNEGVVCRPWFDGKQLTLLMEQDGQPIRGHSIELQSPNDHRTLETNADGKAIVDNVSPGVWAVRFLETDNKPGNHEGVAFKATKKYTTTSFIVPRWEATPDTAKNLARAELPEGITSFGATAIGNQSFVYGGHTGSAHSYSNEEQFHKLITWDVKTADAWREIAQGPKLQGNALVASGDSVIVVGGFTALNSKNEESKLQSQRGVHAYDLKQKRWSQLPDLPEPRSSMDAIVHQGFVYVVGGWNMPGDDSETQWLKTAWRLKLDDVSSGWQSIAAPPFQRRAIALASHGNWVFAIGGMDSNGGPTTETCCFDPQKNAWTEVGPIAGVPMNGFGAAALEVNGKLLVTTADGSIQQFNDALQTWSIVGQSSTGRFFHRMIPLSSDRFALVGGANMEVGKYRELEAIHLAGAK